MDIDRLRAETPGCRTRLHFHNSGAALMPQPVLDAVHGYIDLEAEIGGYEAAAAAADRIQRTYGALAELLGCATDEIGLVENATVGWQLLFYGYLQQLRPGDKILIGQAEYGSYYIADLQARRRHGVEIVTVPDDAHGQIDVARLEEMIDPQVKLISLCHVPTSGGLVNPAAAVGKVARRHGIPYLLDACQSIGQISVDVEEIGCEMLSGTGRKYLRGPRGTGFLYVRREMAEQIEPPLLDMRSAELLDMEGYSLPPNARRFENWEYNLAGVVGLGVAVDCTLTLGIDAISSRIRRLAEALREQLSAIPDLKLRDLGQERCGIVSFTHPKIDPPALRAELDRRGISMGSSTTTSSPLDMNARGMTALCRPSVHYYNTEEEVARFVAEVRRFLAPL